MSARLTTGVGLGEYANSILQQVKSFDQDEFWKQSDPVDRIHIGVEPMLLALSMELALKAWYVFDHDSEAVIKSHDLLKLFEGLKIESQEKLDQEFKRTIAPIHINGFYVDYGIADVLSQHADAFVEWRYLHERNKNMRFETGTFIATLELVLQEFKKRYRVKKMPPLRPPN